MSADSNLPAWEHSTNTAHYEFEFMGGKHRIVVVMEIPSLKKDRIEVILQRVLSAAGRALWECEGLSDEEIASALCVNKKSDDSWIPRGFKQGMADIAAGRVMDLDEATK